MHEAHETTWIDAMSKITLATFGSYGDIFPYLAIGACLSGRGHKVTIAAPRTYAKVAQTAGLEFAPIRPDVNFDDTETFSRAMDPRKGTEFVVREIVIPNLRDSYADLEAVCCQSDLVISHCLTYAVPILAEQYSLRWLSSVLSPLVFCSAYDPPALAPIPWLAKTRVLGPSLVKLLLAGLKKSAWSWSQPIRQMRRELGLNATTDPLWEGQFSPYGTLALFEEFFAQAQPDWPSSTEICGFPFYDRDAGGNDDEPRIAGFMKAGTPPLVFSLGTSGAHSAPNFYNNAVMAAKNLGQRCIIVHGNAEPSQPGSKSVLYLKSAPVHELFGGAKIVIHAGGVGTTAQVLRAGKPQLVVPFSHDQFDNALRVERLGLGLALPHKSCKQANLQGTLEVLLDKSSFACRAEEIRGAGQFEDQPERACDLIESALKG